MAITRTPLIDDDGSGSSGSILNNAWQTTLYNAIDAADVAASTPTYGTFTPTDTSGAALVFTTAVGKWAKYGQIVFVWLQVVYPATANGLDAKIGSFPYICRSPTGGSQGFGAHRLWWLPEATSHTIPKTPATGVNQTNTNMSGANVIASFVYLTD